MLQDVITRMTDNSRACKTWAVTLVAAILVAVARFGASGGDEAASINLVWIATVPVAVLGYLDAHYLVSERWFRKQYCEFVNRLHTRSLDRQLMFVIQAPKASLKNLLRAIFSPTIWPVYWMMIAAIFAVHQLA